MAIHQDLRLEKIKDNMTLDPSPALVPGSPVVLEAGQVPYVVAEQGVVTAARAENRQTIRCAVLRHTAGVGLDSAPGDLATLREECSPAGLIEALTAVEALVRTRQEVAELFGLSASVVSSYLGVAAHPELVVSLRRGEMTLRQATLESRGRPPSGHRPNPLQFVVMSRSGTLRALWEVRLDRSSRENGLISRSEPFDHPGSCERDRAAREGVVVDSSAVLIADTAMNVDLDAVVSSVTLGWLAGASLTAATTSDRANALKALSDVRQALTTHDADGPIAEAWGLRTAEHPDVDEEARWVAATASVTGRAVVTRDPDKYDDLGVDVIPLTGDCLSWEEDGIRERESLIVLDRSIDG